MHESQPYRKATELLPFEGSALLYPSLFTPEECRHYLEALQQKVPWKQEPIRIFGKEVMQPRLTAWYGDTDKSYRYSGVTMTALPWIPDLLHIRERITLLTGHTFNSALLNLYRDGQDSMGWHRDNEKELGPDPVIASLSFGMPRVFRFRNYQDKKHIIALTLQPGSLLVMSGPAQRYWEHQAPRSAGIRDNRINITFRTIKG